MRFLATGAYVGFLPLAPGTWGSLLGLGLFVPLAALPLPFYGLVVAALLAVGVWCAGEAERLLGRKDASPIVIDEVVGMLAALSALPPSAVSLAAAFVLFRLFDILKPLPWLERLQGGWGVMLDDLCAAGLAQLGTRVLLWLVGG
ncbi:MAG: phosphatidylglycerophosphatase A [Candidatus Tectimicrobiota bacterium]|nr:MAG: phosphatidylglycerophosphatase A [Candidatus Tectomicrobia bacterium]